MHFDCILIEGLTADNVMKN